MYPLTEKSDLLDTMDRANGAAIVVQASTNIINTNFILFQE
jgi:hypothetical protein